MATENQPATIDDYIRRFPPDVQAILEQMRQTIHHIAPDATETMSYGMPTFDRSGKHLVFFAGWKHHVSLYPLPAGDEALQRDMAQYKRARGSIQFPLDRPIPYPLIERIVTWRVQETSADR